MKIYILIVLIIIGVILVIYFIPISFSSSKTYSGNKITCNYINYTCNEDSKHFNDWRGCGCTTNITCFDSLLANGTYDIDSPVTLNCLKTLDKDDCPCWIGVDNTCAPIEACI